MKEIQRLSRFLITLFNILLITIPLINIASWTLVQFPIFRTLFSQVFITSIKTPEGMVTIPEMTLTPLIQLLGICGSLVEAIPLLLGLMILKVLFKNYQQGDIFSYDNAKSYQQLGWLFFLQGFIAKPISELLLVLAATYGNAPGHRYLSLGFGTPNFEVLFCGTLIIVISWVMREATKLQHEQRLTI